MSKYWPGTKILKSTNNDFNWKGASSAVSQQFVVKNAKPTILGAEGQTKKAFTIYTRAKPSR